MHGPAQALGLAARTSQRASYFLGEERPRVPMTMQPDCNQE